MDGRAGVVRNAVNLGWREVALAAETAQAVARHTQTDVPVWIENDANVQALGEYIFGAAQGIDNFVHIAIGSGLGSGILLTSQQTCLALGAATVGTAYLALAGTSWGQGKALAAVALAITAVSLLMTPVTHQLRSRSSVPT